MAKIIRILAASVGGGIALGAGIRLGEAIAGRTAPASPDATRKLLEQLDEMENRLKSLEHGAASSNMSSNVPSGGSSDLAVSSTPFQASLDTENRRFEEIADTAMRLRGELRGWLEENVAAKMTEVATRLREDAERSRKEMLDALVEGVQSRVVQRISRVEEEVANQSAALSELRDCSLRTERSVQQLLGGIDRLIVAQPAPSVENSTPPALDLSKSVEIPQVTPIPSPAPEPVPVALRSGSGRWRIFG